MKGKWDEYIFGEFMPSRNLESWFAQHRKCGGLKLEII